MDADHIPDAADAAALAEAATAERPIAISRFTTGAQHYVYEARFAAGAPVVVRIARDRDAPLVASASRLSHLLRPLGVPLPAILTERLTPPLPHLILERLPGTDFGHVVHGLLAAQLTAIAAGVAKAQALVATTPSAGRYGYAATPEAAPRARWSEVLADSLARSRGRIAAAGLFEVDAGNALEAALSGLRAAADAQPATPFLHDTTSKNVIIAPDGTLSGIVDVDDLCYGDPRWVIALTLASLIASGGPQIYTDSWLQRAGLVDDPLFRLYVALFLFDFMSEHGQIFNGNPRESSLEARARLLGLFEAAVARVGFT